MDTYLDEMELNTCTVSGSDKNTKGISQYSPDWGKGANKNAREGHYGEKEETGSENALSHAFGHINSESLLFERECNPFEVLGFPSPSPPPETASEGSEMMNKSFGGYRGGGRFNTGRENFQYRKKEEEIDRF